MKKRRNTHSDARNPAMLPRATSSREIGQAQSTGGDFLHWLHPAL